MLNGTKMFATNGTLADFMLVFCRTDPENPNRHRRFSFILVPTDTPGFSATKIRGKMGIRASDTAELALNNVRVPAANLVGNAGEGFYELMNTKSSGSIGTPRFWKSTREPRRSKRPLWPNPSWVDQI